jgi:predicted RNase H-like HicB family nuclease
MTTATYLGVVERGEDGFGVFFPSVPGCVSAADTLFEAMTNGEQALAAHLELLAEDGEDLPQSDNVGTEFPFDPEVDVEAIFLARAELPGRTLRLNITMDEGLVARIDRVAKNRSAFLAEAAREALARRLAEDAEVSQPKEQSVRQREYA